MTDGWEHVAKKFLELGIWTLFLNGMSSCKKYKSFHDNSLMNHDHKTINSMLAVIIWFFDWSILYFNTTYMTYVNLYT